MTETTQLAECDCRADNRKNYESPYWDVAILTARVAMWRGFARQTADELENIALGAPLTPGAHRALMALAAGLRAELEDDAR